MKRYLYHIFTLLTTLLVTQTMWGAVTIDGGVMSGTLILTDNTYLRNSITVKNGTSLTIDLAGFVLSGNGKTWVIIVEGGATCTIKDSDPTEGHACSINDNGILMWPQVTGQTQISVAGGMIYNRFQNTTTDTKGISVSGTCIIESAKIMGCFSTTIGAAMTATSSGQFTMKEGEVAYNYSVGNNNGSDVRGSVVYGNEPVKSNGTYNIGSSIDISNTGIYNNYSGGLGGAIYGWKVKLDNCEVYSNKSAKEGGAVYIKAFAQGNKKSSLVINKSKINNNVSQSWGGAIYVDNATMTVTDSEINYNDAVSRGGGIYALNTDLTMSGSDVSYNEALGAGATGGGIRILSDDKSKKCVIDNCSINHNYVSTNGGGIHSNIPTTIKNSKICYNRAMASQTEDSKPGTGRGGGFYFTSAIECVLENTDVLYNAAMWYGGGGQVEHKAKLQMLGTTKVNYNKALLHGAGGLHLTSEAHLALDSGEISYNEASTVGGAIHTSYGCSLELNGGSITGNTARQRGGGVHVNTGGDLILNGTDITENRVYRGYDIVYCTVIRNNDGTYTWSEPSYITTGSSYELESDGKLLDSGYGGGVLIDSGTCTMNSGSLSGNYAEKAGGGLGLIMIRVSSDETDFNRLKVVKFILNGGTISGNSSDGNGGGVYLMRNKIKEMVELMPSETQAKVKGYANYNTVANGIPSATIVNGLLTDNASNVSGAAIMMEKGNFFVDGEATLSGNSSNSDGGGIYIGGGSFSLKGKLTAKGNTSNNGNGGAIYLGDGTFVAENSNLQLGESGSPNSAPNGNGGAIYCAGSFTVKGTSTTGINYNKAKNGGAIYALGNVAFSGTVEVLIDNNTASASGGAIYVDGGNISIENPTRMLDNIAGTDGGVAYVKDGSVTLSGSTKMSGNKAMNGSGGVFYVIKDKASSVGVSTSTGEMKSNTSGANGGVFYVNGGNITLGGKTTMESNRAVNGGAIALKGGVFTIHNESLIQNNAASGNGGGIWVDGPTSDLTCLGGSFIGNTAGGNGGGLYAVGNVKFDFAANMQANNALNGGGLYIDGGMDFYFGQANQANGLIVGNAAKPASQATLEGSNSAGVGGGIYLNQGSLTFNNKNQLGIYNNYASYEAADIYASGESSTLNLPNVTGMNLTGFDVPGSDLYWVRDFAGKRYETMLRNNEDIAELIVQFKNADNLVLEDTQCLDLGYDLVFVTLIPVGLDKADNAAVTISYPHKQTGVATLYRKIVLEGIKKQVVGLPSNNWQFDATPWSFTYDENQTYDPPHATESKDEDKKGYILIKRNLHQEITITFSQSETQKGYVTYDVIKVNPMRPGGSNN